MAVKSIIDVQVNDAAFRNFKAMYDKFEKQTAGLPTAWARVNKEIDGTKKNFNAIVAGMAAANVQEKLYTQAQKEAERLTRTQADRWRDLGRTTKSVAGNIKDATVSLLKWTGILTAAGGLLGAGGLWGIDRLAQGASDARRRSLGTAVGYGEQQAFGLNFGRLVEPQGFLQSVFEASHDISKRQLLYSAGLSSADIDGKTTGQISVELLDSLRNLAKRTPEALLAQTLQSRGLDQFVTLEDFQRLRATGDQEYAGLRKGYSADARKFAVQDQDLRRWQDFLKAIGESAQTIETALLPALAPLADGFAKLSAALSDNISSFIKSGTFKQWVDAAEAGVENFAKYLGSKAFQDNLHSFEIGLSAAGKAIYDFLKFLGYIPNDTPYKDRSKLTQIFGRPDKSLIAPPDQSKIPHKFVNTPKSVSDILQNIYGKESAFGAVTYNAKSGASGPFQIMPETASLYSLGNPYNFDASYVTAQQILSDYIKEFHGDLREAVAAYNWGPGHVARDVKKYGAQWDQHLPAETRDYLAKVLGTLNAPGTVVRIENNSGGNAVITVSQMAH